MIEKACIQYGCYKSYCWASCTAVFGQGEWCYTTKGSTADYNYVKCNDDDDCQANWHCAGPCALFTDLNSTNPQNNNMQNVLTNDV